MKVNGYEIKSGADLRGYEIKSGANLRGANLYGANLYGANLRDANLRFANLHEADLYDANLYGADLSGADLYGANLRGANLHEADLCGANLRDANLRFAGLSGADLSSVNLRGADLRGANLYGAKNVPLEAILQTQIVPEKGAFDGFKKCQDDVIVRLRIPASAKRSNATGRKCRAERAKVVAISGGGKIATSDRGGVYRLGEYIECDVWGEDRWNECAGGIHFFITEEEAKRY